MSGKESPAHVLDEPQSALATRDHRRELISRMPVVERYFEFDGISTAVLEGGEGPPVVLLHGPSAYAAHWTDVISRLIATHRVIAPDLPGHGETRVTEGVLDVDRVLTWLGGLIDRTCASPPALVGHLLGGAIAARFAIANGFRLSRLILVDTMGLAPFQPAPAFGLALHQFLLDPTEGTYRGLWRHCAFDLDTLLERMGDRWAPFEGYSLELARMPSVQAALSVLMAQFGAPEISPRDLDRIAVPTTLIWGRHDRATPVAIAEAARSRFKWPLYVIESCADDPPVERPEDFVRVLRAALAECARNAP